MYILAGRTFINPSENPTTFYTYLHNIFTERTLLELNPRIIKGQTQKNRCGQIFYLLGKVYIDKI